MTVKTIIQICGQFLGKAPSSNAKHLWSQSLFWFMRKNGNATATECNCHLGRQFWQFLCFISNQIRGILDSLSLDSLPLSWFSSNHRLEIRSTRTVKSRHCSLRHITVRNKNLESSILRMLPRISRQQNWFWLEEFYRFSHMKKSIGVNKKVFRSFSHHRIFIRCSK